jgi:hypothetical protein
MHYTCGRNLAHLNHWETYQLPDHELEWIPSWKFRTEKKNSIKRKSAFNACNGAVYVLSLFFFKFACEAWFGGLLDRFEHDNLETGLAQITCKRGRSHSNDFRTSLEYDAAIVRTYSSKLSALTKCQIVKWTACDHCIGLKNNASRSNNSTISSQPN